MSRLAVVAPGLLLAVVSLGASDVPGSKDPAFLTRFAGSEIFSYSTRPFDHYVMARGPNGFGDKTEEVEGRVTRLLYHVPPGHTSLEVLRNYEGALKTAGFTQTFEIARDGVTHEALSNPYYFQNRPGSAEWDSPVRDADHILYVTAKGTKNGKNVTVAVLTLESRGLKTRTNPNDAKSEITIKPGQVIVGVDVVEAATPAMAMVDPPADSASKEPAYLKRRKDAELVSVTTRPYDRYVMARGDNGFDKTEDAEGQITRLLYRIPGGATSLEVFRDYEAALKAAGFATTFEIKRDFLTHEALANPFYFQNAPGSAEWDSPVRDTDHSFYVTGKATKEGRGLAVAVLTTEVGRPFSWKPEPTRSVTTKTGDVLVGVDVVEAKPVAMNMVDVKADSLAKSLTAAGNVNLYGVYFDIDKTNVKPESKGTLDEVAKLLKGNPSLKLEVAGHTDNSGTAAHNLALSKGRANAVVQALVKDYGIAATRLQPAGYGDTKPVAPNTTEENKAKNRRVELRKIP